MRLRVSKPLRQRVIASTVLMMFAGRVASGPFAGMKLQWEAAGSSFYPKLTGTYEYELHIVWERVIQEIRPSLVIDIGAAEGYYSVGIARALPDAQVIAYERDEKSLDLMRNCMRLNRVSGRISERGYCDSDDLARDLENGDNALVICDTEGFEKILIDPSAVPGLRNAFIVVETHDHLAPGAMLEIQKRFAATHYIESIECELDRSSQSSKLGPFHKVLPKDWRFRLLCERMRATPWLWMQPKHLIDLVETRDDTFGSRSKPIDDGRGESDL